MDQAVLPIINKRSLSVVVFLIALLTFSVGIGGDIFIVDEARNAECAREMLERGDLIVPTYNYELRTDKPPLHYFFMMIAYSLFGVSAWSARLFSVIFGALTVLIVFRSVSKWLSMDTAFWTMVVLLSSLHAGIQFHQSVPDPYLIFFITSTLLIFFEQLQEPKWFLPILFYVCMGLGVLAKGPIAIALPGAIMLIYMILMKQCTLKKIMQLRPIKGIIIIAIIVLPWYYAVHLETNGEWTKGFFLEHNVERFSSTKEGHGGSFLIAPVFVLAGMLPFSAFFVRAYRQVFKGERQPLIVLATVASLFVVGFFAVSSTRLPNYTAPAYSFFAIIIANFLTYRYGQRFKVELVFLLCFSLLLVPGGIAAFYFEEALTPLVPFVLLLIPAVIGSICALRYHKQERMRSALFAIAIGFLVMNFGVSYILFDRIGAQSPVQKTLSMLEGHDLAYYKSFEQSYPFYLKRKVPKITTEKELESFFKESPDGIVITHRKRLRDIDEERFARIIFEQKDIFEGRTTVLLKSK